jgi:hypothetical protein
MLDHVLNVLGETHGYIMSGEPAGHGWVLGIGILLIYGTLLFVIWGGIQAIAQRNPLCFLPHRTNKSPRSESSDDLHPNYGSFHCL